MSEPIDLHAKRMRGTAKQRQAAASPYRSDAHPYPDRIAGARELAEYTIEQLAKLTDIPEADLELFESGLSVSEPEQLLKIGMETGFPMAWFSKPPDPAWPGIEHTSLRFH